MSILKIGISSRALFDLNEGHEIYKKKGIEKYADYQRKHEDVSLDKGVAFSLVEKLLKMNRPKDKIVEVILLSRNSSDTGLRIFNSIEKNKLDITRAVFSGGESPFPYVDALDIDLFLSADVNDVKVALENNIAAAHIFTENYAAVLMDDGSWFGSLEQIDPKRGYWLRIQNDDIFDLTTYESPIDLVYSLHYGNNLISYIGSDNTDINEALPDEVEDFFTDIFTENLAATKNENGEWIGILAEIGLQHLKGYWVNVTQDLEFSYVDSSPIARNYNNKIPEFFETDIPFDIDYSQSQQQAFYFIEK